MSGVVAVQGAPAASLSRLLDHLLEATPELRDAGRQQALTDRFLAPALPALRAFFLEVRAAVDAELRPARAGPGARPYPLGLCLEITQAVRRRMDDADAIVFSEAAAQGRAALRGFLAAGGVLRRAWGDLRGQYFQNAMILGVLYVDVANDTVVTTKPPVEILPFAEAGFSPIAGYPHFARIASRYWGDRLLPNHVLPELAPCLPVIHIGARGAIRLGAFNNYMIGLTVANRFRPSAQVLAGPPMPPGLFGGLAVALRAAGFAVAASAEAGRAGGLALCRAGSVAAPDDLAREVPRVIALGREINRRLERVFAIPAVAAAP